MFDVHWKGWRSLAIAWLIFISILFFLPGKAFPRENWFSIYYIDKLVHIGFFAVLTFLWSYNPSGKTASVWLLLAASLVYGIAVELIQGSLIINRDSDPNDVLADMLGAVMGILFWRYLYKKINPCRNRGRNQN